MVSHHRKNLSARKKVDYSDQLSNFHQIPLNQRSNLRSVADASGIPKTNLHRLIKDRKIRAHSNYVKPILSKQNKIDRLIFCKNHISENCDRFIDMYDTIQVEEKWFYMTKNKEILSPER